MRENEHKAVILVHSTELLLLKKPISAHTHSSRKPIKKSVQPNYYKEWKVKRLHLIEDTKICLKPVGKIARTVAAPHTKLLEPNQEQALCDFRNLWRTNVNPL